MASKNNTSIDSETEEEKTTFGISESNSATAVPKKMGVVRYCQVKEVRSGIASILKRRYATEVHTLTEWDSLYDHVLNRKVK